MRSGTGRRPAVARWAFGALLAALCCGVAACGGERGQADGERHFERGRELRRAGDLAGAKREFQSAVEIIPDSDNAHYLLGLTLDDLGEHGEAARAFEKAVALNPSRAVARHGYGNVLRRLGDHAGDLREQAEAVRLEPNNPAFLIALGSAQEQTGDLATARASFERAAAVDAEPKVKATALMRLGYVLAAGGETGAGIDALRRGLELDPSDEYARGKLAELEAGGGVRNQTAGGAGDADALETILSFVERFRRAVESPGDTYPVPPKPEEVERMAAELGRRRSTVADAKLKARVEESLKYMPFLTEASRAFWAAGGDGRKAGTPSRPNNSAGGVGGGTGPGVKPTP